MSAKVIQDCAHALRAAGEIERADALLKVAVVEHHDDGGSAFPRSRRVKEMYMDDGGYGRTRIVSVDDGGMTLRDHFAGQALIGELTAQCEHTGWYTHSEVLADRCYEIANAMILRRARK
jgi:hypothetical protein